jgi:hypothetical protein
MSYRVSTYKKKDRECTKCNKTKLISEFRINKDRLGVERYFSWCHECNREANRVRHGWNKKQDIRPKAKNYISNKELYMEIIVSKAQGKLTRKAEKMIILIGNNVIRKFYYQNLDDRSDCLNNGLYQAFRNWMMFEENKTQNPFGYFTEIIKRGIAGGWKEVNKGRDKTISISSFYADGSDLNL